MIIEVEGVNKSYKKNFKTVRALDNVNFKLKDNTILGILGPNGAGKTTLLKTLCGIITADTGSIKVFGNTDINEVKRFIGFLPEHPEFFKNITATELLRFALRVSGVNLEPSRIDDVFDYVNLADEKKEKVRFFSKGMLQRIGIAQAIVHQPELLILDEPMSGLDPLGRKMVIRIIKKYFKEGKTILFATHNLEDIEELCTDVLVLNKGKILYEQNLAWLKEHLNYQIEVEENGTLRIINVKNYSKLWGTLDEIRIRDLKINKIYSGLAQELEKYYEQ